MIVGFDKQEIELLIEDLRFTVSSAERIVKHYEAALQRQPEQTQWLKVIGRTKGRADLAQYVINKLSEIID